jgi:hypothetical protein
MGKGGDQKPVLAVALDDSTRSVLEAAAKAIEASPEQCLGVPDLVFVPETRENFQMTFVLCTERLHRLPSEQLQTLHDDLRRHVGAASLEKLEALPCRGFEMFGPDRSHLIARFRPCAELVQLRRTMWRSFKEFNAAYPDAMWAPHIRLGRIKASRSQLNKVAFNSLPSQLNELHIQPRTMSLLGERPKDPYCECDWDIALNANESQLQDNASQKATGTKGTTAGSTALDHQVAAAHTSNDNGPLEESFQYASKGENTVQPACAAAAPSPAKARTGGFVAELPKFRRPAGERGPTRPGRHLVAE